MTELATGYVHAWPTLTELASSVKRAMSVPSGFTPTTHSGLLPFFDPAWKQYAGTCTGWALAKMVTTVARANDIETPELSALFPYYFGRARRGRTGGSSCTDCAR